MWCEVRFEFWSVFSERGRVQAEVCSKVDAVSDFLVKFLTLSCSASVSMNGEEIQAKAFHEENFHDKFRSFFVEGVRTVKYTRVWKTLPKSSGKSGSKMGILFSFGLFRSWTPHSELESTSEVAKIQRKTSKRASAGTRANSDVVILKQLKQLLRIIPEIVGMSRTCGGVRRVGAKNKLC